MEDKPVFMKEPEEGPYPIATANSLDAGSQHGDKEDEVRPHLLANCIHSCNPVEYVISYKKQRVTSGFLGHNHVKIFTGYDDQIMHSQIKCVNLCF